MSPRSSSIALSHRQFRPRIECLEKRLPYALAGAELETLANTSAWESGLAALQEAPFGVELHLGAISPAFDPPPFSVVGIPLMDSMGADIIPLNHGGHAFVWTNGDANGMNIQARFTTPEGLPGNNPFLVASIGSGTTLPSPGQIKSGQLELSAAPVGSDGFVVVWSEDDGLHGQIVDGTGTPVGSRLDIVSGLPVSDYRFSTLSDAEGGFYVSWYDMAYGEAFVARYSATGESIDLQAITPPNVSYGAIQSMRLIAHPTDAYAIEWIVEDGNTGVTTRSIDPAVGLPFETSWTTGTARGSQATYLSDGHLAIVSTQVDGTTDRALLQLWDSSGNLFWERELATTSGTATDHPSLAISADGTFVVSFFGAGENGVGFYVQAFSATGETLGTARRLDDGLTDPPHGMVIALDNLQFAAYWTALALDGVSPIVMTRRLSLWSAPLHVHVSESVIAEAGADLVLVIEDVPPEVGLSAGSRLSDTSWRLGLDDLPGLQIISMEPFETLELKISVYDSIFATEPLYSQRTTFGTHQNDLFVVDDLTHHLDGRQGDDTAVFADTADQYAIDTVNDWTFVIHRLDASWAAIMEQIEQLQFLDQTLSVTEFLAMQELPEPTEEPEPAEEPAPIEEEPTEEPPTEEEEASLPSPTLPSVSAPASVTVPLTVPVIAPVPVFTTAMVFGGEMSLSPTIATVTTTLNPVANLTQPNSASSPTTYVTAQANMNDLEGPPRGNGRDTPVVPQETRQSSQNTGESSEAIEHDSADTSSIAEESIVGTAMQAVLPQAGNVINLPGAGLAINAGPANAVSITASPWMEDNAVRRVRFSQSEWVAASPSFDAESLSQGIDEVQDLLQSESAAHNLIVGSAVLIAAGFSMAQILWLLRGSVLLTKFLTSMPIWVAFDPLPIVGGPWKNLQGDDEHQESLVDIARAQS